MTAFKWINFAKHTIELLKDANCNFSYNIHTQKICTLGGEDITPHLMAVYNSIDEIKDDYWREKICKVYNIPYDSLFPTEKKKSKYKFIRDKMPKVYISGKVSGLEKKEYMNNFNSAELYLTGLGYDVINPVSYTEDPNWTWKEYMQRDLKLLVDCDYIYLLEGWQDSKGARIEYSLACDLGIHILTLDHNGKVV